MSKFSDNLVYLRKREGLSQQELADKMEVSRSLVGMYESGQRMPSFEMLEALADIFNVNIDFLIGHKAGGDESRKFRDNLARIIQAASPEDIAASGVNMYEIELIINGGLPLSFDMACQIADQLGETLDSMMGADKEKSALDTESGLDMEIINLLLSLPESKKAEGVNFLRYLAKSAGK